MEFALDQKRELYENENARMDVGATHEHCPRACQFYAFSQSDWLSARLGVTKLKPRSQPRERLGPFCWTLRRNICTYSSCPKEPLLTIRMTSTSRPSLVSPVKSFQTDATER